MKTTREIIDACDALDVKVHVMRSQREPWEYHSKSYKGAWGALLSAERDGVKVEVAFQTGETFDAALAAAWSKFEPASTAGLPPVPVMLTSSGSDEGDNGVCAGAFPGLTA